MTTVSLLIFCLDDLSINTSGVLKSPTIIVLCQFPPLCLLLFAPVLGAYMIMSVIFFSCIDPFIIIECPSLSFVINFVLKSTLSDMSIATWAFLSFPFMWNIFFHHPTFSLYVSLALKWVSCKWHIDGSCFFIQSATLCLLVGAFSPLTFKVIIDSYVLIAILLLVSWLFLQFFSVLFFF